jgi:hypothetical protein
LIALIGAIVDHRAVSVAGIEVAKNGVFSRFGLRIRRGRAGGGFRARQVGAAGGREVRGNAGDDNGRSAPHASARSTEFHSGVESKAMGFVSDKRRHIEETRVARAA